MLPSIENSGGNHGISRQVREGQRDLGRKRPRVPNSNYEWEMSPNSLFHLPQALNNLVSLSRKSVSLQCAVIGAGLGWTLCRKLSSVVKGHLATLYERHGFGGGIGAGIGIVSNEIYFLEKQWNVDMSKSRPIVSKKMARHDWKTRQVQGEAPIGDYKAKFGTDYYGYNY
jgi:hypothetical protein